MERVVSPEWAGGEAFEDLPSAIEAALEGEDPVEAGAWMGEVVAAGVPGQQALFYYYEAISADGVTIGERVEARLATNDSLSVAWRFRWDDTPTCQACADEAVVWPNQWIVVSDVDGGRGMIRFLAEHPSRPLNAEIWFYPDPLRWPEAQAENDPVLVTGLEEAMTAAASILDSIEASVVAPSQ